MDLVVVATPHHWHVPIALRALQAGKDVYCEKPASHTFDEGRLLVQAAKKYGRIFQHGTQTRSSEVTTRAREVIASGYLGEIKMTKAWNIQDRGNLVPVEDGPTPEGVDYDTWLGPAETRPYNRSRFHGSWRWFFDFGTGDLGTDGVHRLDYAIRGLNAAREGMGEKPYDFPLAAASSGGKYFFDDPQEWPDTLYVTYDYPKATIVYEMRIWSPYPHEGVGEGAAVYGEKGYVIIGNLSWRAFGADDEPMRIGMQSTNKQADPDHKRNFLHCVRTRKTPNCDIGVAMHTNVGCHLGNASWRANKKLTFNPATFSIGPDAADHRWVARNYRKKWSLPVTV